MEPPTAGFVVLVRFPFSDLSGAKLRPALVLASLDRGNRVLCQITSRPYADPLGVAISEADFAEGSLQRRSFARPGKLFTAHRNLLAGIAGRLEPRVHERIVAVITTLLQQGAVTPPG